VLGVVNHRGYKKPMKNTLKSNMVTTQDLNRVKKALKGEGYDLQTIDFKALDKSGWDTLKASFIDNYGINLEAILFKPKKSDIKAEIEKEQEREDKALITNWLKERAKPLLKNDLYELPKTFIELVLKKYQYGIILLSETALGKTNMALSMCDKFNLDYEYISTKATPLGLYQDLYENKNKDVIILDDIENILDNPDGVKILMAVLWPIKKDKRIVNYSTSKRIDTPKRFEIEARVIMLVNEVNRKKVEALLSRSLYCEIKPTYKQKVALLYELSEQPYKELKDEERLEIVNWIEQITNEATENLNLRTLIKGYEFYRFSKEKWKELISKELRTDDKKALILSLIERNDLTTSQQLDKWKEATGLSKTQFYAYKKALMRKGSGIR